MCAYPYTMGGKPDPERVDVWRQSFRNVPSGAFVPEEHNMAGGHKWGVRALGASTSLASLARGTPGVVAALARGAFFVKVEAVQVDSPIRLILC